MKALLSLFTLLLLSPAQAVVLSNVTIFFDDFEGDSAGWTTDIEVWSPSYTIWEQGEPNSGPLSARSGLQVFGTDLDAVYSRDTETWLRSPVIDLSRLTDATISFYQSYDIEPGFDFGQVSILDAEDSSLIMTIGGVVDGIDSDWERVTHHLPPAALGRGIQVEFRLRSDDIGQFDGWYIDDFSVISTVPEPDILTILPLGVVLLLRRRRG